VLNLIKLVKSTQLRRSLHYQGIGDDRGQGTSSKETKPAVPKVEEPVVKDFSQVGHRLPRNVEKD
jgi:hypothetical protein